MHAHSHVYCIYIYFMISFRTQSYDITYSYLKKIICTQSYGFEYSNLMLEIMRFQVIISIE